MLARFPPAMKSKVLPALSAADAAQGRRRSYATGRFTAPPWRSCFRAWRSLRRAAKRRRAARASSTSATARHLPSHIAVSLTQQHRTPASICSSEGVVSHQQHLFPLLSLCFAYRTSCNSLPRQSTSSRSAAIRSRSRGDSHSHRRPFRSPPRASASSRLSTASPPWRAADASLPSPQAGRTLCLVRLPATSPKRRQESARRSLSWQRRRPCTTPTRTSS